MRVLESTTSPPVAPAIKHQHRRGLARLLIRTLLLTAPVVLFLVFFEIRFATLNPSHFAAKKALLQKGAASIQTLVLGSSHELTGVDPSALGQPAFNLASQSQSLYYDAALVRKYRPLLPALKRVVLAVSYFSLEYELANGPERWRSFHYRYFHGLPHQDWHNVVSARNLSAYFLSAETTRARVLAGTSTNAFTEYDEWGGWTNRPRGSLLPMQADTNALRNAALGTLRLHHGMMRAETFEANVHRLDALIGDLRRDGIEVLLVTLPVTRYYTAGMRPETYGRMQASLRKLSRAHGVAYHNFMGDPRFEDADFADGDHLNSRGADKLTRFLKDLL